MNNLINITLNIIEKIVFIEASEKPSILKAISLQLIGFDSNNVSSSSLEMFSERFSAAQISDSLKKPCSIPKW